MQLDQAQHLQLGPELIAMSSLCTLAIGGLLTPAIEGLHTLATQGLPMKNQLATVGLQTFFLQVVFHRRW